MISSLTESLSESFDVEALIRPVRENVSWKEEVQEESLFPALSWKQRFLGCFSCMVLGYIISFGSFFRFGALLMGNPFPFVLFSTIGNIVSLCGSCFLRGPSSQITSMFKENRRVASILYLASLFLTLLLAFTCTTIPGISIALILLLLCQFIATGWYCMSYIPFAREGARKVVTKIYSEIMEG